MSARGPLQRLKEIGSLQVFVLDVDRRPTLAFEDLTLQKHRTSAARPTCGPILSRSHRTARRFARQIQRWPPD